MDLKKLAKQLGLSPTTVSRVLNGRADQHRIAKETQERVRAAARVSNATVNQTGRSLRLGLSQVIGLVVPDISNPFFATAGRSVERAARARGYSVLLADSQESAEEEGRSLAMMKGRNVDGLIVAPVGGRGGNETLFSQWGRPLVVIDRAPPALHPLSVVVDNREAARRGTLLLAAAGHRAIACIRGDVGSYADQERFRGYREALKELGCRERKGWVAGGAYAIGSGREGVGALLALPGAERPTAILALGNLLALGALDALREKGLSVPGDLSLVSFDEQPWAASMAPPLTTIAQPVEQIGEMAVTLLLEAMGPGLRPGSKRKTSGRVVLPCVLIERASVAPPRRALS